MGKKREALLGIAVGKKGVGKTYATLEIIQSYLKGNPAKGVKPRKVLILDVNNEFVNVQKDQNSSFQHIKALALSDVKKFTLQNTIEARRISVLKPEGGKMNTKELQEACKHIVDNYQNGLLLLEDMTKFVSDTISNDLVGSIISIRHSSVDLMIHFQSLGKACNPKLWANMNYLRFHKIEDTVEKNKNKIAGDTEHLKILEQMVNTEYSGGNKRFYAYFDKDMQSIKGSFNKDIFKKAIVAYLEDNISIVDRELAKTDLYTGKAIHKDRRKAVDSIIENYIKEYYGNPK